MDVDRLTHYRGTTRIHPDLFFKPGLPHELEIEPLEESLLRAWIVSMLNDNPLVTVKKGEDVFQRLLDLLAAEIVRDLDTLQHGALQSLLHSFLIQAERLAKPAAGKAPPGRPAREAGRRFMEMLETDDRKYRKVADDARKLGLAEKRLQAATSEGFGK